MDKLFFDNWEGILRVAVTSVLAYLVIVFILRVSGKRTLAKMNAFDFVVTIALGSILGAMILNKSIPILEGLTAVFVLIGLQFLITFISVRSKKFTKIISSSPTLLYYNGQLLEDIMKRERIAIGELNKSVREAGYASFEEIDAIVLESTGDLTVITNSIEGKNKAMKDVENY